MNLVNIAALDWAIIVVFLLMVVGIGSSAALFSKRNAADFFLSGRTMPWWLLGVSMVACTFSCDTPNLVTDIVRTQGVSGNWAWWAFLLTGMLTVFVYAKLWRRSALDTDLGFYEIRYSGRPAAFLRGFRSLYLGIVFNVLIMATVSLAAIKIGQVMFGLSPIMSLVVGMAGVAVYATLGGLTGSIWADFFQYLVAMAGAFFAAYYAVASDSVGHVGSLGELFSNPSVQEKMTLFPRVVDGDWSQVVTILILPVAVQWWNVWYPGSEPGGGGYIAQRMLSAKDEKNAVGATLLFNFLHYAVRPWPWIIVALVSLTQFPLDNATFARDWLSKNAPTGEAAKVEYMQAAAAGPTVAEAKAWWAAPANAPLVKQYEVNRAAMAPQDRETAAKYYFAKEQLAGLKQAFPKVDEQFLRHDIAYPAMISKMPKGWLGLIIASLIAAYMSTIATHLNWGSSYFVQDFYVRFVNRNCSPAKAVLVGRLAMLSLLLLSALVALWMRNAKDSFNILLQVGAGTGLIYILRWFWWRINAYSEISAMAISFLMACFFQWGAPALGMPEAFREAGLLRIMDFSSWALVIGICVTTVSWLLVTCLTPPEDEAVLASFCRKIRAGGPGWRRFEKDVGQEAQGWDLPAGILCMVFGCAAIWSALFGAGRIIYGDCWIGCGLLAFSFVSTCLLLKASKKVKLS